MFNDLNRLVKELFLVKKILPLPLFITWLLGITKSLNILIKTRSLGILDRVFGESFHILWNNQKLYFSHLDFGVAEFFLFKGDLTWTQSVKNMALEYHPDKGNADELENILKSQGFIVRRADHKNLGYFYCTRVSSL